jgi:membrane-bound inhibitor of C-type lysozyme
MEAMHKNIRPAFAVFALGVLGCQHTTPTASGAQTTTHTVHYRCEGKDVTATFSGENASLSVGEQTLALHQVRSASGTRYADSSGNGIFTKGDEALLSLAGEAIRKCTAAD